MRIAQIAPLNESVPPVLYGGTERVVAYLTDELVRQGHDVTLFASGDSRTAARLVPAWPRALRLGGDCQDALAPHVLMLELVAKRAADAASAGRLDRDDPSRAPARSPDVSSRTRQVPGVHRAHRP